MGVGGARLSDGDGVAGAAMLAFWYADMVSDVAGLHGSRLGARQTWVSELYE